MLTLRILYIAAAEYDMNNDKLDQTIFSNQNFQILVMHVSLGPKFKFNEECAFESQRQNQNSLIQLILSLILTPIIEKTKSDFQNVSFSKRIIRPENKGFERTSECSPASRVFQQIFLLGELGRLHEKFIWYFARLADSRRSKLANFEFDSLWLC